MQSRSVRALSSGLKLPWGPHAVAVSRLVRSRSNAMQSRSVRALSSALKLPWGGTRSCYEPPHPRTGSAPSTRERPARGGSVGRDCDDRGGATANHPDEDGSRNRLCAEHAREAGSWTCLRRRLCRDCVADDALAAKYPEEHGRASSASDTRRRRAPGLRAPSGRRARRAASSLPGRRRASSCRTSTSARPAWRAASCRGSCRAAISAAPRGLVLSRRIRPWLPAVAPAARELRGARPVGPGPAHDNRGRIAGLRLARLRGPRRLRQRLEGARPGGRTGAGARLTRRLGAAAPVLAERRTSGVEVLEAAACHAS